MKITVNQEISLKTKSVVIPIVRRIGLNAFTHRNNTVYNKHEAVLHEIGKHRERQAVLH